jgi:hypothetical protein
MIEMVTGRAEVDGKLENVTGDATGASNTKWTGVWDVEWVEDRIGSAGDCGCCVYAFWRREENGDGGREKRADSGSYDG